MTDWSQPRRRPCSTCGHDALPNPAGPVHADHMLHVPYGDCACPAAEWPPLVQLKLAAAERLAQEYGTKEEGLSELRVVLGVLEELAETHEDPYLAHAVTLIDERLTAEPVPE